MFPPGEAVCNIIIVLLNMYRTGIDTITQEALSICEPFCV